MLDKSEIEKFAKDLIAIDKTLFDIEYETDKIIFGNQTPNQNDETGKWFKFRSLYLAVWDLNCKIGITLGALLEFNFESIDKDFNPALEISRDEFQMFYYLENIIYRQITLWDLLAQFYNIHYDLNLPIEKIEYKRFFNNHSNKNYLNIGIISKYVKYQDQEERKKTYSSSKQHQFVSEYRNSLTHRISDAVPSMSNLGIFFKEHPLYLLEMLIADLKQCLSFYDDILAEILGDKNKEKLLNAFLPKGKGLIIKFEDNN